MKLKTGINRYIVTQSQAEKKTFEDDYVSETMGAFGYMQGLFCGTAVVSRCITSWNMISIVFLTSKTEFACIRFEDGSNRPAQDSTCYDDCLEYEYHSSVFQDTLISTFGLICDRAWLASFTQTITMLGLAFGVTLLGWLSDRFGRRIAFLLSIALSGIFMIAAPFSPNYWLYNFFRFLAGFGAGGIMTLSTVYNVEMVGPKYRELAGANSLIADGFGIMLLAAVAYYSSTWQTFLIIFGLISLVIFVLMLSMPESPRWLVSQRRTEEAIEMMTRVAKLYVAGTILIFDICCYLYLYIHYFMSHSSNRLETTHIKDTVSKAIEELESEHKVVQKQSFKDLFNDWKIAKMTIICLLIWLLSGICYFGINHYATLLGLNIFVIVPLMGLFQVIGNIMVIPINKYAGRKISIFCTLGMVAIMMIILIFIPDGHWGCAVTTGISIIFSIAVFCVLYIHANEMYPTPLRNMGLGVVCCGSKVGAMVAPFIANMQSHWISSAIFAVVPMVGAVLCLLLPETKGKKMKDIV